MEVVDVSVLIISFNTKDITRHCIESFYQTQKGYNYEIIVVDNHSHDGSVEMIRNCFPEIHLIANETNRMFPAANNQAAQIAQGRYLLLLNSDTILLENSVKPLIDQLQKNKSKRIVCAGPKVLNTDLSLQSFGYPLGSIASYANHAFKLNKLLPKALARKVLPIGTPSLYDESHEVGWVAGCCLMIDRSVYDEVGGLEESLEFYGEEPVLGYRLMKKGYRTWVYPDASIIHIGGASSILEEAKFLQNLEDRVRRYVRSQEVTIGFEESIKMSRIILFALYPKYWFLYWSKQYRIKFRNQIIWEKRVIQVMKDKIAQKAN